MQVKLMKALTVHSGSANVTDVPRPANDAEALVRVLRSGICNTDLEIIRGYAGFDGIIGHEFVGRVENCRDKPELVGKRAVGEINAGCGQCSLCGSGDTRHCPDRTVLGIKGRNGSHAEYLSLPSENLLEVPDIISDEQAVFIEPLAAAIGITERVDIGPDTRVAVIGDGKLGQLCVRALACVTSNASLVGKHSSKLRLAKNRGIQTLFADRCASVRGSFDVVVEASGAESGFALAMELVRPRGSIVLKSTFHGRPTWEAWRVVVDEISVVGSRCGRFAPAIKALSDGSVFVDDLISEEFHLDDAIGALKTAGTPGVMKVLLKMPA